MATATVPQQNIYCQVEVLDVCARTFLFSPALVFGNNAHVTMRRDNTLSIVISGNRHQLAAEFARLAQELRGGYE